MKKLGIRRTVDTLPVLPHIWQPVVSSLCPRHPPPIPEYPLAPFVDFHCHPTTRHTPLAATVYPTHDSELPTIRDGCGQERLAPTEEVMIDCAN
jgi:hypothetical protein